jgi:hypothetical protein
VSACVLFLGFPEFALCSERCGAILRLILCKAGFKWGIFSVVFVLRVFRQTNCVIISSLFYNQFVIYLTVGSHLTLLVSDTSRPVLFLCFFRIGWFYVSNVLYMEVAVIWKVWRLKVQSSCRLPTRIRQGNIKFLLKKWYESACEVDQYGSE